MSMDLLTADIERVYLEYFAAREQYEKTDPAAPAFNFVKQRFDEAMRALHLTRRLWREIGEASGERGLYVKTEDNAEPPPDLVPAQWTERKFRPGKRGKGDAGAITASGLFYLTFRDILQNDTAVDLLADSIKFALFTNSVTSPNFDTNTAYAAAPFNANEISGTGYTAGGAAIANDTITVSSGTLVYDGDDVNWASSTITNARGALFYDDTITTPTADPAVGLINFGADYSTQNGTFTIQFAAGGIFTDDLTP